MEACTMTLENFIDVCAGNRASEFDVAQVVYFMGRQRFRYMGENEWAYCDDCTQDATEGASAKFKTDARNEHIHRFCSSEVVHVFMQRALHFQELLKAHPRSNYDVRVKRLLDISIKLRNPKYVADVLREAKSFFEHH